MTGCKLSYGGVNSMTVVLHPAYSHSGQDHLLERNEAATYEGISANWLGTAPNPTIHDPLAEPSSEALTVREPAVYYYEAGGGQKAAPHYYLEIPALEDEWLIVRDVPIQTMTTAFRTGRKNEEAEHVAWCAFDISPNYTAQPPVRWWGAGTLGGMTYHDTTSPFVLFSRPFDQASSFEALLTYIRFGELCEDGEVLGQRLEELAEDLDDDVDSPPLSVDSIAGFIEFLLEAEPLRDPGLVVAPNGNLRAEWHQSWSQHFVVEFASQTDAKFVLFAPDPHQQDKTMRLSGTCSIPSVYEEARRCGVAEWVARQNQ